MTPWTAARQTSLSITNSQSLLEPMSIESVMPSNHLILIIWLDYETIIGQVGGKPGLKWKPDHRGQQSFVRESTLHVGAGPYCSPFTVCQGQGDVVRFICYIMPLRVCAHARA